MVNSIHVEPFKKIQSTLKIVVKRPCIIIVFTMSRITRPCDCVILNYTLFKVEMNFNFLETILWNKYAEIIEWT